MANKLTQAEITFLLDEIKSCEERQRRELIERWQYPLLVSYYEGLLRLEPDSQDRNATRKTVSAIINKHFPKTNVLISEIMFQTPDILAEPTKPFVVKGNIELDVEVGAPLMGAALKYGYDKTGSQEENRVALFDMIYAGYCAVEVDQIRRKKNDDNLLNFPTDEEMKDRSTGMIGRVKESVKNLMRPKNAEEAEEKMSKEAPDEKQAYATVNETYVRRWDPLNILFDWQAKTFKESRYIIKKRIMSRSKFNTEFPKFKDKVASGKFLDFSMHQHEREKQSVIVYEMQIKRKNDEYVTVMLTPTLRDNILDMFKRPYTTNGFNIKIGTLHKYGKIYPVPIARINKTLSDEMNEYIYSWKEIGERNVPKFLVNTKKVKADGISALRSRNVNDIVDIDGAVQGAVEPLKATSFSNDNKDLFAVFQGEQDKTWNVSDSKVGGTQKAKFATELQIQEAGFQQTTIDIQEGLRKLIQEELDTMKDIIATFWDGEFFIKVTGGEKPEWYVPDVIGGVVTNPLAEMLSADYHIKVDIDKAFRPNTEKQKSDLVLLMRELISQPMQLILAAQGRQLSSKFLDKIVTKFGQDPELMFEEAQQPAEGEGLAPGNVPEEMIAEEAINQAGV